MMFRVWAICTFIGYAEFWLIRITLLKYSLDSDSFIRQFERSWVDAVLGELCTLVIAATFSLIATTLTYTLRPNFMEGADDRKGWLIVITSLISFVELYGFSWFVKTMIIDA
jgi:hypothetical protein